MKPRDIAFDRLPPGRQAIIRFSSPLQADEEPFVVSLKKDAILRLENAPGQVTLFNTGTLEVPYLFAIVPKKLAAFLHADWRALAAFVNSLRSLTAG